MTVDLYWGANGRLDSLRQSGINTSFYYDGSGRLIRRDVNGVVQSHFLWEESDVAAELGPGATTMIAQYAYSGMDRLHAIIVGGTSYYAHIDELNSVRGFTSNGQQYSSYRYDDWGQAISGGSALGGVERALWKGALLMEPSAGFYYMRNRWYETRTGRFLSEDPAGLRAGVNQYTYGGSDAINAIDPTGAEPWCFGPVRLGPVTIIPRICIDVTDNGADNPDHPACSSWGFDDYCHPDLGHPRNQPEPDHFEPSKPIIRPDPNACFSNAPITGLPLVTMPTIGRAGAWMATRADGRSSFASSPHRAVDLGAPMYTPVFATMPGQVSWGGPDYNAVIVVNGPWRVGFLHNSVILVEPGEQVQVGDVVALVGDTSPKKVTPHLHYQVDSAGVRRNPLAGCTY